MEEFHIDLHNPNKQPLSHMNSNTEFFSNLVSMEGFSSNLQGIMQLANEGLSDHHHHHHHQPHISSAFMDQIQRSFVPNNSISVFDQRAHFFSSSSRGRDMTLEPEILVNNTTSAFSIDDQVQNSCAGKKRKRVLERETEKPREVVHVRAKRGQATDSHSLAERLRREKINEKLKCLQDLVPGCYKTMGMAVMLDVIINYVRSLQNQIDFLSMKLSDASLYYDFNSSEAEAMEAIQRSSGYEAQLVGMDKVLGEAYEGISQFQTTDGPTSL